MEAMQFTFDLTEDIQKAITEMGYEEPTPIQSGAIPPMLTGRDIIGQAQTGTGKTAAFGIPLIQHIDPQEKSVQAIVLCPTRELALQTAGELTKIARYRRGISVLPVYGGQPIERQLRGLRYGAQVVVGTPGRVMDHIDRGSLKLEGVRVAVLDEADEMLDMGFRDDIEKILQNTPDTRQTALFSATMPRPILQLSNRYLKEPVHVAIAPKVMTVEKIVQSYISVRSFHKVELLARLLVRDNCKLALVFCNTKRCVEDVVTQLQSRGFTAAGLHGDMRQIERDAIMARFRQGFVGVLVATDVAARGLDIDDIEVVFNYDMPQDVEYYVHRIGRTGRAGREGRAYTFVVAREVSRMWEYRKITGAKILCEQPPTGEDIRKVTAGKFEQEIIEKAQTQPSEEAMAMAQSMMNQVGSAEALAATLELLMQNGGTKTDDAIDIRVPELPRATSPQRPQASPQRRGPYGQPAPRRPYGGQTRKNDRKRYE